MIDILQNEVLSFGLLASAQSVAGVDTAGEFSDATRLMRRVAATYTKTTRGVVGVFGRIGPFVGTAIAAAREAAADCWVRWATESR